MWPFHRHKWERTHTILVARHFESGPPRDGILTIDECSCGKKQAFVNGSYDRRPANIEKAIAVAEGKA